MATIEDLRTQGYKVDVAFDLPDTTVYNVSGYGLMSQVRGTDEVTINALVADHPERVLQVNESREQTTRRWVRQKRIPPLHPQDVT